MWRWSIWDVKNPLIKALNDLSDFARINNFEKDQILDKTFKSIVKDLMVQFRMKPGVNYEDDLNDNEPGTEFVVLSKEADDLLGGLMEGRIVAISAHVRKSKSGK
jgi:hypothetical protein